MKEVSVYSVYFMIINGIEKIIVTFSTGLEAAFGNMIAKKEDKLLQRNFGIFEFISFSTTTILFASTTVLIIPFIRIYTQNVIDVDYIRHTFAYLFILGHALYCIRMPYHCVVLAAGHYKQTRNGAFVEAIINVVISIIFTYMFGIIGVAIGSVSAMLFRTIQYMMYLSKHILRKSVGSLIKRIGVCVLNCILILLANSALNLHYTGTYSNWILNAFIVTIVAATIALCTGIVFCSEDMANVVSALKNVVRKKRVDSKTNHKAVVKDENI